MSANHDGWTPLSADDASRSREARDKRVDDFIRMKFSRGLDDIAGLNYTNCDCSVARPYTPHEERMRLFPLIYNFERHGLIGNIRHYTKKTTLKLMMEYVKTYF